MSPSRLMSSLGLLLAGGVVGWLAHGALAPSPPPLLTTAPAEPTPPAEVAAHCPPCEAGPEGLDQLRNDLAAARGLLEALENDATGVPVPFPDDLPAAYRPETFEATVREALADCDVDVQLQFVDCSEYPCYAIFEGNDPLKNCDAWNERFPNEWVTRTQSLLVDEEGRQRRYTVHGETPPDVKSPGSMENRHKRHQARASDAEAELMGRWGARPLTDEEMDDLLSGRQ